MTERYRGTDALRYVPFNDVSLAREEALDRLTDRAVAVVNRNHAILYKKLEGRTDVSSALEFFDKLRDLTIAESLNRGLSITERELDIVRGMGKGYSLRTIQQYFITQVFPGFYAPEKTKLANPGLINMGYILDLLYIIDPDIATFEQGVQVFIEAMRMTHPALPPFILGAMVDDSKNLRNTSSLPIDLLVDTEAVAQFEEIYRKYADPRELKAFEEGISMTLAEVFARVSNFSIN